jgi:hypothetical protein
VFRQCSSSFMSRSFLSKLALVNVQYSAAKVPTVQHAESREPIQSLRAGHPQSHYVLSTNSVRGASDGQQCDCVVGRTEQPV